MSMDLYVLYDSKMPSIKRWQKNIEELNFDLIFSPNLAMPDEGAMITGLWKGRAVQFESRLANLML